MRPAPSPPQNTPNDVSITPTANFIAFSGTRASGARTARPTATTSTTASRGGDAARRPVLLAPKVSTMNATSSPSSSTALNHTVKA